uniref:Uncharacterized protein n=1 Tax=Timema cristinae TaxID=61476 RepID=A0A7R9CC48_TIMCR|nr:unnamed protein product [Timema cristinae]
MVNHIRLTILYTPGRDSNLNLPINGCSVSMSELMRLSNHIKKDLQFAEGTSLALAMKDIALGLPAKHVTVFFDQHIGIDPSLFHIPVHVSATNLRFPVLLSQRLHDSGVMTRSYNIKDQENQPETSCRFVEDVIAKREDSTNIILCSPETAEHLIAKIKEKNLIQRNILYMFYWKNWPLSKTFLSLVQEAMRIAVVTKPRDGAYSICPLKEREREREKPFRKKTSGKPDQDLNPDIPVTCNPINSGYDTLD